MIVDRWLEFLIEVIGLSALLALLLLVVGLLCGWALGILTEELVVSPETLKRIQRREWEEGRGEMHDTQPGQAEGGVGATTGPEDDPEAQGRGDRRATGR